ncbi:MAG: hypothetical protein EBZ48_14280, partial [Proteobacteria bacterium]|nr:hypothetical protein [Pseudomonadota bacterium]
MGRTLMCGKSIGCSAMLLVAANINMVGVSNPQLLGWDGLGREDKYKEKRAVSYQIQHGLKDQIPAT